MPASKRRARLTLPIVAVLVVVGFLVTRPGVAPAAPPVEPPEHSGLEATPRPRASRPSVATSPDPLDHHDEPVDLPYRYPVHDALPQSPELRRALEEQRAATCYADGTAPALRTLRRPTAQLQTVRGDPGSADALRSLEGEFGFKADVDVALWRPLPVKTAAAAEASFHDGQPATAGAVAEDHGGGAMAAVGAVGDEERSVALDTAADSLPCTAEVQRRLLQHQFPAGVPAERACERVLVAPLKEGAHGVGSAVTLLAHDLLGAVMLGRVMAVAPVRWYVAPRACASGGWECFYAHSSACTVPHGARVQQVSSFGAATRAHAQYIGKKGFDIPGLSRSDLPSLQQLVGHGAHQQRCVADIQAWAGQARNRYLMGTFSKGTDPLLTYMLAQAARFLMRRPQPWFGAMLRHHLPKVLPGSSLRQRGEQPSEVSGRVVFLQDRGEVAKYREYYNAFGCHTVNATAAFPALLKDLCGGARGECRAFVSSNTPARVFRTLRPALRTTGPVMSTWLHPALKASSVETARWGAAAPFASWVDLYAGVSSTAFACTVQSNWCRVINLLRLTSGRAQCPFVDLGMWMLADTAARRRFCVVRPNEWPVKPFGNWRPGGPLA